MNTLVIAFRGTSFPTDWLDSSQLADFASDVLDWLDVTIMDFGGNTLADTRDEIQIVNSNFGPLAGVTGLLSASNFRLDRAAVDADDYFIFNTANRTLYFDLDGNGRARQVALAMIDFSLSGDTLTNTDIVLVGTVSSLVETGMAV